MGDDFWGLLFCERYVPVCTGYDGKLRKGRAKWFRGVFFGKGGPEKVVFFYDYATFSQHHVAVVVIQRKPKPNLLAPR